ncbi:MAG: DUF1648 domain-containing protein [bacterium]|nr:DUF1648 domain-containing protein [bacterium]
MGTRVMLLCGVLLLAGMLAYSLWLYPSLPDRIPTHWNWKGEVDGWSNRAFGSFFLPGMSTGLFLLLLALPWLSPKGFQVEPFRSTYNLIVVLVIALMAYIHVVALQAALNPRLDVSRAIMGGIFLLFGGIGLLLGRVKRNFWVGVRTPWTLASETVWDKTHHLSAWLFTATGVLGTVAIWLGVPPVICFVVFMALVFVPVIYSLVLYKQLEKRGMV